jgi:hypothetical protein
MTVAGDLAEGGHVDTMQIEFTASEGVRQALASLGRTEDVKFSPSSTRLAIAGFAKNKILVVEVAIVASRTGKSVELTDCLEVRSPSLRAPHGLSFIDDETLVVANRFGMVPILSVPPRASGEGRVSVPPLGYIRGSAVHRLESPGSVCVVPIEHDLYEVLICENYVHCVTRHVLDGRAAFRVRSNEVLLRKALSIPDGVAVNHDRRWISISNHNSHSVLLFENTPRLNRRSEPLGVLSGVDYPHGVFFSPDDRFVFVADAGTPNVRIYAKDGDSWQGLHYPVKSVRVMDDETFLRGRNNPEEGGPKGIDVDRDANVLVMTTTEHPLAFYDLRRLLNL